MSYETQIDGIDIQVPHLQIGERKKRPWRPEEAADYSSKMS